MRVKQKLWLSLGVALALIALGVRLLFVEAAFKYGLILIGAVFLAFLVWKAFIKSGQEDLSRSEERRLELESEVKELKHKLEEVTSSPLNVTSLSSVLHLAVLNIDTSFTRTYVREDPERRLEFNGALKADICAEYGIRLEEVRFRYDEQRDTLMLSDFHPGLLSFSKKQLSWKLARSWHGRSILGIPVAPASDALAEAYTREMKESIRAEVEAEIDSRSIAEFEWLAPVVSRQVTDVLRAAIGRPTARVEIVESAPATAGFLPLGEFYQKK